MCTLDSSERVEAQGETGRRDVSILVFAVCHSTPASSIESTGDRRQFELTGSGKVAKMKANEPAGAGEHTMHWCQQLHQQQQQQLQQPGNQSARLSVLDSSREL